jgi:RND family efflux transporter MFP subunit
MAEMAIRNIVTIAVVAVAASVGLAGCGGGTDSAASGGKEVRAEIGQAVRIEVPRLVTASGSLEAANSAIISTRMMGWIKHVHVDAGQRVKKGDPLVSIDDTDLRARKAQAEAGIAEAKAVLANAETMVARFERLYADDSVSKAQLDEVTTGRDRAAAGLAMAKAALREVNVHLGYLDIVAPSDGLVARRMVDPGDMANPGMPLLVLEQPTQMKVVAHVGEKDVSTVSAGAQVSVDVTSLPDAVFATTIDRVVPTANPGSHTYDVEAQLENPEGRLKSGMFARMSIPVGTRSAILVPSGAVIRRGQLTGVWIVDDQGRVGLRWVRLGRALDERVEVLSGLAGGETIVLTAATPLAEGDKVVR